jgi:hypothetical protein
LAQDTSGNIYTCTQTGTIPESGTRTLPFQCQITGPIACPSNTVTKIYRQIPGWDTINNSAAGTLGRDVENRNDFEYRRRNSVFINASGSLPSIYANVFNVPDVLDVYVTENSTSAPVDKGVTDYTLAANSIYVAVVGGSSAAIAQAIWLRKNEGSNMNGNTSVTVKDTSYDTLPYPTYPITFNRPDSLPILFSVSIVDDPELPSDIETTIQLAIINAFNGGDGAQRIRIASTIYASRFYGAVTAVSPILSVNEILVGTTTATLTSVEAGIDQAPTISQSNITVIRA